MKKNVSQLRLKAFFFIYYDQVLNNLYTIGQSKQGLCCYCKTK